jgi:hypothetical protein
VTLAIVGVGLVSPFGRSPREHVFFRRAGVPGPFPAPFVRADDRAVRVLHCPWLDAEMPVADRLAALAATALDNALAPLEGLTLRPPPIWLGLARARPGLDIGDLDATTERIRTRYKPPSMQQFWAEAGVFAALKKAEDELARRESEAIAFVVADSYVSLAWLTHVAEHPPTRWESARPRASEAAAALVVMSPELAGRLRVRPLAMVRASALAIGAANDDNDEPVDAIAMGAALRELGTSHVAYSFGQDVVDALRREDWYHAVARQSDRFWECQHDCLESDIGLVGAASGAASLVYGVAALRTGAVAEVPATEPFVAWAISRDGTRGMASVSTSGR